MRETIAHWSEMVAMIMIAIGFIAWTVEACAKGEAVKAAIYSPLAIVFLGTAIIGVVLHFGWLD